MNDILKYTFVLKPLVDIAPESIHPVTKSSFLEHWKRIDKTKNSLVAVDIKLP